ncbi:hypothetical protein HK097_007238 [Rhizophlyctis rosea]|uniref:Uncharacterized protein n=1 Tax=Rhizophlyctis rosea TaxID=64517 RepID=A0AAD5X5B8_9FUNG|nr:hypothetical protein HK097_007238 [Rhizophlyctis rosea]
MSDAETEVPQEEQVVEEEAAIAVEQPKKKKRVISPEAKKVMLENLAKAREAKKKELKNPTVRLTKYPKEKRERAKEMYEEDIEKKAEAKAKELAFKLLKEEREKEEMEAFQAWKESQKSAPEPRTKKKAATKPKPKAKAATKPKAPPKKVVKRKVVEEEEEDFDRYAEYAGGSMSFGGINMDDYLS